MSSDSKQLTVKEASEYLGISVPRVYGLLKSDILPSIKESSRKTLIAIEDLDNYRNGVESSKEPISQETPEPAQEPLQEEVPEPVQDPTPESIPEEISFKLGDRLKISNIENRKKAIWMIKGGKFEAAQVDSEFIGIIDNIIHHEGRDFVYLTLDKGTSKWCILGEQIKEGLFPFAEDVPEVIEESIEEPLEELPEPSNEEDDEEPTEKLKELMKDSRTDPQADPQINSRTDFEKLIDHDDHLWQLVKSCDKDLKEYIREKGKGSDAVGYSLELGKRELIYQPKTIAKEFNWPVAMEFFLTNRYLIWKMLKENGKLTKEFIEKVEMDLVVREEIKIR